MNIQLGYVLYYVNDVQKTLEFFESTFELERGFLHESLDYGELKTGQTRLGFVAHSTASSHGFEYRKIVSLDKPPGVEIGLVCENVHDVYQRAILNGAIGLSEPKLKPWGQTVSYVQDPNGILIEICSKI